MTTVSLEPIRKLDRDIKAVSATMTAGQARSLVDLYYALQDERMGLKNQARALAASEEPHDTVAFFGDQFQSLEKQIAGALDAYSGADPLGQWARSIYGIGPVIAAGLLAHIDITRAPTAGAIWRYAGLDASMKWHGSANARELVKAAFQAEESPAEAVLWLARAVARRPTDLLQEASVEPATLQAAMAAVAHYSGVEAVQVAASFEQFPLHVDNAILNTCESLGVDARKVYGDLYRDAKPNRDALVRLLAKRPWNAELKVLCWKIGESFAKFSGRDECFYGKLYVQRKEYELARDVRGGNAETAKETLATRNIRDKATLEVYNSGKLPPGRLDRRARRWAVKLFLAHYHHAAYRIVLGQEPPNPYPQAHLGHTHMIAPPNLP